MGRDPSHLRSGGGQQPVPQCIGGQPPVPQSQSQQYIGGQPPVPQSQSQQYVGGQPPVPQSQQYNPGFSIGNPNLFLQTLAHVTAQNPYLLNPYFPIQNSFPPCQYPNNFPINQQQQQNVAPNSNFYSQQQNACPAANRSQYSDNNFPPQQQNSQNATVVKPSASAPRPKFPSVKQSLTPSREETLEKIELAVAKVRRNLVAAKEHVSAWKLSQAVLVELQVESWDTLEFQLQEVPSLNRLILIEAKINAFIHCYVAVSRIITLYDIEVAICSNEGIENFEELELGPLVRHPLSAHYFSVKPDVLEVYRITSEEIIYDLIELVSRGRRFQVEVFLDYIAKKHEVTQWERMGLRIHGLGMYINRIREAQSSNDTVLRKCLEKVKNNSGKKSNSSKKGKYRPLFASRKKELDERFNVMTERVTTFSSMDKEFCGKHIRFVSSSSDDDDDGMDDYRSEENEYSCGGLEQSQFVTPKILHDGVSSCPYPSVAEEMTRLGLSSEVGGSGHSFRSSRSNEPAKKKRKLERQTLHGKKKTEPHAVSNVISEDGKIPCFLNSLDLSLDNDSLQIFVTTWKEACWEHSASEVFVRMFQCYKPRRRLDLFLSSYPFLGLLNVAVKSIKNKMWDNIYDAFQSIGELGQTDTPTSNCVDSRSLDDSSNEKERGGVISQKLGRGLCLTVEDIMKKAGEYFVLEKTMCSGLTSLVEKLLMFSWKLCNCEVWLTKQLSVKDFRSLGHGDYFAFLRKHSYLLPEELLEFVNTEMCQGMFVEASMSQQQFVTLLSQASVGLWEDESVTTQKISDLLGRQFPQISFKVTENRCTQDLLNTMRQHRSSAPFNCVLFSATLLTTFNHVDSVHSDAKDLFANNETRDDMGQQFKSIQAVTTNDAIEILLKAPMLSDLNLWSHWDMLYAPTFGPLLMWLMRDVNVRDLLCLLTKDGKILRLDHLATVDSFFQALIEGYAFPVAVQLLSVLAVFGGKRHLPLSLLKCHACQAFEVIMMNGTLNTRTDEIAVDYMSSNSFKNLSYSGEGASLASRLVIDCLGYLPSEFREFAADILLSGLKSVVKDAYPAVLRQCKQKEERLMVHEIGLSLGIMEWIQDHHAMCPITDDASWVSVCSSVDKIAISKGRMLISSEKDEHCQEYSNVIMSGNCSEVDRSGKEALRHVSELVDQKDATHIVKSIRCEEFGLGSDLSNEENGVLEKLNARLGRALNCLSRELYSQDSHFLLELVQNADDNVYPQDVEPTLAFILQESGIVVMNNEQGFTAQNIRALCDVGNSTKKGSSVGYIGKKGIGFKSVFRVTDAPEIHSNGFHIKFDITEGQIGFVLPTIIPPCDIDSFRQLVSICSDHMDDSCWKTCIVLPFRSEFSESASVGSIFSMFSDLHPSLLLFLHRLKCIKLRNMLDNSYIVMRKKVVGDGIVEVSHENEKMTWFVASKKLHSEIFSSNAQNTEISIAFTLRESEDGGYDPYLEQQPVFSFLPLRAYGLKFILQGDFVLPSSREEVDGDSPWNQWLLSEVPGLFVSAEKCFSAIPCFLENPAKAVSAYMSFVPLVGEVHGFFSGLPRMIISKLRITSCLLEDGCKNLWVPPCKLLRNWNTQAILLLPNNLLHEHLGLGFLHRDIAISDALARALGIIEYGPKILVQFISSLCNVEKGIKSMGLNWLSCWLNELLNMLSYSSGHNLQNPPLELDLVNTLKKVPFIPLSDGTYSSLDAGMIWVQVDSDDRYEAFPNLYATLRIVSPVLFSVATEGTSSGDVSLTNNILRMLQKIGIQRLSAHDIMKVHIIPAITDVNIVCRDKHLMTEYVAFLMFHLQSSCVDCHVEREDIFSQLRNGAFILTNHGYRKPVEVPIHFGKEYGNSIEGSRLIDAVDCKWLEVDTLYIKHSVTGSLSCGMKKWREFFENLGVTDFVKLNQVKKSITDLSSTILTQMRWDRDFVCPDMMATDWESEELTYLISMVSKKGNLKRSKYVLEILDTLWEKYFFDKVAGHISPKSDGNNMCFKSSLIKCICDVPWVASTMDNELHCPRELFYDCDAVRSILGACAPYAVPKISSSKLVSDIGFKIQVTIDDVLSILQAWRKSKAPFSASVSQMCKLYTFLWNELPTSRQKVLEALKSGPFIFVPYAADIKTESISTGAFLASEEVFWHDSTGTLDHIKELNSGFVQNDGASTKTLCNVYPSLHDFFVKDCGVNENPSFRHYLLVLKHLSSSQLPQQGAKSVFKVLLRWSEDLSCGALSSGDIDYLKGCLAESECTVLPAMQDKWVSLHPSFGLVCWSDDDILKKEFKYSDNIEFLYFGALSNEEKEMLQTKVSILMQTLGISALSEVVTREAIYYGPADCSFKASLMAWALPFAQRYIFNLHPKKYELVKLSVFEQVQHLRIVVVQKLFYRNVIKRCHIESKKRHECSSLLQGNILYTAQGSDSHTFFMEFSRLIFDGAPEFHLANFLHMIATMAESGSSEVQIEFFILNNQKMLKLPDGEHLWLLSSLAPCIEKEETGLGCPSTGVSEQSSLKSKKRPSTSSWPPVGWKTAPGFDPHCSIGLGTPSVSVKCGREMDRIENNCEGVASLRAHVFPLEITDDLMIEDETVGMTGFATEGATAREFWQDEPDIIYNQSESRTDESIVPVNLVVESHCPEDGPSKSSEKDQEQATRTGRLGELVAYRYFTGKNDESAVKWVNEDKETGLPYDIIIGKKESSREYIEVKATRYANKAWSIISTREWQFAAEMGDAFSVAHVVLSGKDAARITMYKNPVKLCQLGKLRLAILMPRQHKA